MKIKYMGNADVRRLEKGEDFGGRLGDPLDREIEWSWDNNHVINTDDFDGVDDEFWNLLLEEPDFKNVTDLKRIPTNEAQQMWRAMPKSEDASDVAARATSVAESGTVTNAEVEAASAAAAAAAGSAPRRRA